jgi:hypothetical protein
MRKSLVKRCGLLHLRQTVTAAKVLQGCLWEGSRKRHCYELPPMLCQRVTVSRILLEAAGGTDTRGRKFERRMHSPCHGITFQIGAYWSLAAQALSARI